MLRKAAMTVSLLGFLCAGSSNVTAQGLERAKTFHRHNLPEKAKELLINTIHSTKSSATTRAEALYWLGQISFEEGRYDTAMEDWNKLIKEFPQSSRAKEINQRLAQLKEVISQVSDSTISSVIAQSYIRNGDFWSETETKFVIDSSWMPQVEMAIKWYDRVVEEFPGSTAADVAFRKKLFALLGWKKPGRYGSSYGVKNNFGKYMPQVLKTFQEYSEQFPDASHLQGFRYQIAQAYWVNEDWDQTRDWLQKIIEAGGDGETFYVQTAEARLQKVEH